MIERGAEVEKYVVDAVLGQGGMAVVYRVHHRTLGGLHALKVLTIASEPLQRRLLQEGRAQARLQHPNVVEVRDVLDVRGFPGLLMEYVPDGSLADRIGQGGLSMAEIEVIFRGVVAGMRRAHALGFIHRDLKPANVLLARQEERWLPKITDFGLVKCVEDSTPHGTRANVAMGTPGYMSPEQVRDSRGVDMRTDVFALGALLYEMVTGAPPFVGADISITLTATMAGRYTPVRDLAPEAPEVFVSVIEGCLRADRRERLPDCDAILSLLGEPGQSSGSSHRAIHGGAVATTSLGGAGPRPAPSRVAPPSPSTFHGGDGPSSMDPDVASPSLVPERSLGHSAAPAVAPPLARDPVREAPTSRGRPGSQGPRGSGVIWAAGGLFGVTLVGTLAVLGGVGLWMAMREEPGKALAAPTSSAATGAETAVVPATTTPQVASRAAPSPGASRSPTRGTSAPPPERAAQPASSPAAGEPASSPAAVEPVAVTTPEVELGTVRVEGDALDVWLVDGTRRFAPGDVAPGTYAVEASFDASGAVPAGSVTITAGQTATLSCTAALFRCRVR